MRLPRAIVLVSLAMLFATPGSAPAAENLAVRTIIGGPGDAPGQLRGPIDLTIDPAGNVIVADTQHHRIQKFTPDGTLIWLRGKSGADGAPVTGDGALEFNTPKDVAVAPDGTIVVADGGNDRVQRLSAEGTFIAAYPVKFEPESIAVDADGSLFLAETSGNRIHRTDPGGNVNLTWGQTGEAPGQLNHPNDVSVGGGFVYVADGRNARVQKFTRDGGFVKLWGTRAKDDDTAKPGEFSEPLGVSVTAAGRVFVIDKGTARLDEFTTEGVHRLRFGDERQLAAPGGVFARGDEVAIADTDNNRALRLIRTLTPPAGTFCESATGSCSIGANGVPVVTMPNGERSPIRFVMPTDVCVRLGGAPNAGKTAYFANRSYPVKKIAEGWLVEIDTASLPASTKGTVILTSRCPAPTRQLSFSEVNETLGEAALIDPSGFVRDATTRRGIRDAIVTLFSSAATSSGFAFTDPLSVSPRINPQRTDRRGHYGWDVPPGSYRISVRRFGYRTLTASRIVSVPPPVTDLHINLRRNRSEQARLIDPAGAVGRLRLGMRAAAARRAARALRPRPLLRFRAGRLVRIEVRSSRFKTGAGVGRGSDEAALRRAFGRAIKRSGTTYRYRRAAFLTRAGRITVIRVGS